MKKLKLLSCVLFSTMLIGCSGGGGSTPKNVAPEVTNKTITLNENQNKQVVLDATDADGNSLTYKIVKAPSHGIFKDGVYTPTAGYVGSDSFTYVANDGTVDSQEATVNITVTADFDGDDISDTIDTDDDNDGVLDTNDVFPLNSAESVDTDGDGIGNNADTDDDGDGIIDINDVFPLDSTESLDTDGDGIGNNADAFPSDVTESLDTDADGIGNNADTDDDGDEVSDADEIAFGSDPLDATSKAVIISGKITYDLIPVNSNNIGLDYSNIRQELVKNVKVDIVDASDNIVKTITTDDSGNYSVSLLSNKDVKVRVYAKMIKTGTPSWDVKVVDNTNGDALYVMEGTLTTSGLSNSKRDLNADSGAWNGNSYTSTRTAAPFAVLDSVNSSMKKILSADASTAFEPLVVNWSTRNTTSGGSLDDGQIGTSFYTNGNLYILGDAAGDTDEYDDHVIAHEWGHYYEDKFSRSDSIGGSHGGDDTLDIRVAFGEGWGNAFSAMALDNSIYFDTSNNSGWSMDIEEGTHNNSGWFSESSIQRILYDLYDSNDDANGNDSLSLGFGPIHQVFTDVQKVTPAFTSIFSFIKVLKDENVDEQGAIDSIVSSENIATIEDIYGTGRTNRTNDYPYYDLNVGSSINMEISAISNSSLVNKLANRQYIKFVIPNDETYTIKIEQIGGTDSDPDYYLYKVSPFEMISFSEDRSSGSTEVTKVLIAGDYLLDVAIWGNLNTVEYKVSITQ